jgi:limonene-1,2-epoxide hydrolase
MLAPSRYALYTASRNSCIPRQATKGRVGAGRLIQLHCFMIDINTDELEANNAKLVTDFCKAWELRDINKLLPFISDDIFYQMWDADNAITVEGKKAFTRIIGSFLESVDSIEWEIFRTQAMGKIVINDRTDRFISEDEDGPNMTFSITGVFVIENNQIIHWKDYTIPGKPAQM